MGDRKLAPMENISYTTFLIAVQFGYNCAERGLDFEAAMAAAQEILAEALPEEEIAAGAFGPV